MLLLPRHVHILCTCATQIFGPHENEPLDAAGTAAAFAALAEEVNAYEAQQGKPPKTVDEVRMLVSYKGAAGV